MTSTPSLVMRDPASVFSRSRISSVSAGEVGGVESQLDGGRNLVHVLAAWPGRSHEALVQFGFSDGNPRADLHVATIAERCAGAGRRRYFGGIGAISSVNGP